MTKQPAPQENPEPTNADENVNGLTPSEVEGRLDRLEEYIAAIAEPIIKRKDPKRSWWERAADGFENNPFSRLAIGLGAMLAIFSLIGVAATALGVWFQYQSSTEERIARAWQSLSSSAPGNSGKNQAIEFLHKQGERLVGMNLGGVKKTDGTYIADLELEDAFLDRPNMNFGELSGAKFNNVNITWAKASHVLITGELKNTDFLWSELVNSTLGLYWKSSVHFRASLLDGLFLHPDYFESGWPTKNQAENRTAEQIMALYPKLSFRGSSLRCAQLAYFPMTNFKFEDVDISGVYFDFSNVHNEDLIELGGWENLEGAWYYSDNPPIGLPPEQMEKHLFSRDRQTVLDICKKHEPRAFEEDPLGELDGPDGIEMTCVSLARKPEKCEPHNPLSPYARINSLYHSPEEYGLER